MSEQRSYGVLRQISDETLEFRVAGKLQQAWKLAPPVRTMHDLVQRCLMNLGLEGWRPISHQPNPAEAVVLARVPYPAGTKLSVYGTLRFLEDDILVLTVAGSTMQRWPATQSRDETMAQALAVLERQGWRLHRTYRTGATVVRG